MSMSLKRLVLMCLVGLTSGLQAELIRDPTQPPSYHPRTTGQSGTKAAPRWVLSSTLVSPGRRLATINGQTLGVGARVAGARIVSIDSSRVALQAGKRRVVLELLPDDFKRISQDKQNQP